MTKSEILNRAMLILLHFCTVCVLHWWHRISDIDIEWFYDTIFVAHTWYGQTVSNKGKLYKF
jgi:hypothetical protein